MLVLSRKVGDKVMFPGLAVTVTVLEARAGVVWLGFTAPADVVILREELCQAALETRALVIDDNNQFNERGKM